MQADTAPKLIFDWNILSKPVHHESENPKRRLLTLWISVLLVAAIFCLTLLVLFVVIYSRIARQRDLVSQLEENGWHLLYEHQWDGNAFNASPSPSGSRLIRAVFGDDVNNVVVAANFCSESHPDTSKLHMFPELYSVSIHQGNVSQDCVSDLLRIGKLNQLQLNLRSVPPEQLEKLAFGPPINELWLHYATDEHLIRLVHFKSLRHLHLINGYATDSALIALAELSELETLEFTRVSGISEAGVAHFSKLVNLQSLVVLGWEQGRFPEFATTADKATEARVRWGESSTIEGRKPLRLPENLRQLTLDNIAIGKQTLAAVGKLHFLESLSLSGSTIDDSGLQHLQSLPNIQFLDLSGTDITDSSLQELQGLQTLKFLALNNLNEATEEAVRHLEHHLPNCSISFPEPIP